MQIEKTVDVILSEIIKNDPKIIAAFKEASFEVHCSLSYDADEKPRYSGKIGAALERHREEWKLEENNKKLEFEAALTDDNVFAHLVRKEVEKDKEKIGIATKTDPYVTFGEVKEMAAKALDIDYKNASIEYLYRCRNIGLGKNRHVLFALRLHYLASKL